MTRDIDWAAPMPPCDTHRYLSNPTVDDEKAEGIYDGPTRLGPHGNMCEQCFDTFGYRDSTITLRRVKANA